MGDFIAECRKAELRAMQDVLKQLESLRADRDHWRNEYKTLELAGDEFIKQRDACLVRLGENDEIIKAHHTALVACRDALELVRKHDDARFGLHYQKNSAVDKVNNALALANSVLK